MTFTPVLPTGGFAGWAFLSRTRESQEAAFAASSRVANDVDYFRERIAEVKSAEALVSDRRLLRVALGAFGLQDDIGNLFFIRTVLEDGTLDPESLSNRLSDKRYFALAKAFGFGDFDTPRTVLSEFPDEIAQAFVTGAFEVAVGEQDPDMRLALGLDAALSAIAERETSDDGRWYAVMGEPPVRAVFETALALPASVGALDLDQQLGIFRDRLHGRFGSGEITQFADADKRQDLIRSFLLQAQLKGGGVAGSVESAALTLLHSAASGATILATLA